MSLNISRRDFMKLSAVTAVAVAASGSLTGCFQDANKPTRKGDGKLTLISVTTNVTKGSGLTFDVDIECNRDNDIAVNADSFSVVIKTGETTTTYPVTLTKTAWRLAKGESLSTTVTCAATAASGDTVTLRFSPDDTYKEMYASWIYTIE